MKTHVKIATVITLIFAIAACSVFTPNATTQPAIQNGEEQNQISAGFTDDEEIPFIILHQNGEQLAVTQDVNSKEKTGIVWASPEGNSVVIYSDKDGNPKGAVVGDDILLYSNYDGNKIDITLLHPDGTSEVFNGLEIDTTLINKVKSKSSTSYNLVSFSNQNSLLQTQDDEFWNFVDHAFIVVGVASCLSAFMLGAGAGAAAGGAPSGGAGAALGATAGAIATFAVLVSLCGSTIVDIVIKAAEVSKIDVIPLKTASFIKDLNDCQKRKLLDWLACGKTLTTILKTLEDIAYKKINDNSEAKVIFEIQSNSQGAEFTDCAQFNLTPEECANAIANEVEVTCKTTKCWKPDNPTPGMSYYACEAGAISTHTYPRYVQAWNSSDWTKISTNVYTNKEEAVGKDETRVWTIAYRLDGFTETFDFSLYSGYSGVQSSCEAKITK